MTHPITPPPESLVRQWAAIHGTHYADLAALLMCVADQAAQWGADQELKAVCQLLFSDPSASFTFSDIRAARRPKPPSLKEEGFTALELLKQRTTDPNIIEPLSRALEALND